MRGGRDVDSVCWVVVDVERRNQFGTFRDIAKCSDAVCDKL